ncbi:MAG: hypothetical protein WC551_07810 [Patescibacteria group bacterium]
MNQAISDLSNSVNRAHELVAAYRRATVAIVEIERFTKELARTIDDIHEIETRPLDSEEEIPF